LGLISAADAPEPPAGPERRVYTATAKGRATLADALENKDWAAPRDRPPFLTWVALSWQARPGVFEKLQHRTRFLEEELTRKQTTLRAIRKEVGHRYHEAVWMVRLMILQFRTELRWLQELSAEMHRRGPARHPSYSDSGSE
jgi:DNA-binding PadR family transcriptional regulator